MSCPFGKCDCGNPGCCDDDDGCMANGIRDVAELPDRTSPDEMKDISIDLETLSTRHDAAVLSIGAVAFDRATGEIGDKLYVEVDVDDAIAHGHVSGSTLEWWVQQSEKARQLFGAQSKSFLAPALNELSMFITQHRGAKVWGNGATFDITILEHAYTRLDLPVPWKYWDIRDMRTIVETATAMGFDKHSVPFEGTKHSAVDDAAHQARVIARSWTYCCARNAGGQAASCTCPLGDGSLRTAPCTNCGTPTVNVDQALCISCRPASQAAPNTMADPTEEMLNMLGREHPMAKRSELDTKELSYEHLRRAFCLQQPWPVPDQACIVWRADLMKMSNDLTHKQAFFDNRLAAADMHRRALTAEAVLGELEKSNPHAVMNARTTFAGLGTSHPLTPQGQIDHG